MNHQEKTLYHQENHQENPLENPQEKEKVKLKYQKKRKTHGGYSNLMMMKNNVQKSCKL